MGYIDELDYSNYYINNKGKIYSLKNKKILSIQIDKDGYETVKLTDKQYKIKYGKRLRVHRLVGKYFLPNGEKNYYSKSTIDHIDKNKLNNNYTNLRWTTYKENTTYATGINVYKVNDDGNVIKTFLSKADATKDSGQKSLDLFRTKIVKAKNGFYYTTLEPKDNKIDINNLYKNKTKCKYIKADLEGKILKVYNELRDIAKDFGLKIFSINQYNIKEQKQELLDKNIIVKKGYLWKKISLDDNIDINKNLINDY